LLSLTIPNGVTDIGDRCFSGCISLQNISVSMQTLIGKNTLKNTPLENTPIFDEQ
jgi:hypothetical protein